MAVRSALSELAELQEQTVDPLSDALSRHARAVLGRDGPAIDRALLEVTLLIEETMTLSDLLGRRRLLLEADDVADEVPEELRRQMLFASFGDLLGRVPFAEQIADLVRREPRLARSADAVARLYRERHVLAIARAATQKVTERVQRALVSLRLSGTTTAEAEQAVAAAGGFTRSYAETVYRTNLATANTAGRMEQAKEPDVQPIVGGFMLVSPGGDFGGDGSNRPNHLAAHGLVAATNDPIWDRFAPPLGYNCRDTLRVLSRMKLQRMGLIAPDGRVIRRIPANFAKAHPDPGFGGASPARKIYG